MSALGVFSHHKLYFDGGWDGAAENAGMLASVCSKVML